MLEQVIPTIWASATSWLTPAVLFLLLNLVIGTIAVSSKAAALHYHRAERDGTAKLARSPSSVLGRLRSLSLYRSQSGGEIPLETETVPPPPAPKLETLETLVFAPATYPSAGEIPPPPAAKLETLVLAPAAYPSAGGEQCLDRCQSETIPVLPSESEGMMKKSASARSAESARVSRRRPAVEKPVADGGEGDGGREEVDARADDFINRFRQQLHLQRLDSLIRYKEMIRRGQ